MRTIAMLQVLDPLDEPSVPEELELEDEELLPKLLVGGGLEETEDGELSLELLVASRSRSGTVN